MSFLTELIGKRTFTLPQNWRPMSGGVASNSGVSVSPQTALKYTAVYACVRVLAESVASLPLPTYERLGTAASGGRLIIGCIRFCTVCPILK